MSQSWTPDLSRHRGPRYQAIADAIAGDMRARRLKVFDQLPAQRQLAVRLGLDVTTVARGYAEARRRGLIRSQPGLGTFVCRLAPVGLLADDGPSQAFVFNAPPPLDDPALLARMGEGVARVGRRLQALLPYTAVGGAMPDRQAARQWLALLGIDAPTQRLLLLSSAQAGVVGALSAITRRGDGVLCERLTHPGIKAASAQLGLRLHGLAEDAQGIEPAALAEACLRHAPRVLYLNPLLRNPTTGTMPLSRRLQLVELARRCNLQIIEDDAFGMLPRHRPASFATLAPERSWYVASLSKSLGPGLRVSYLLAPAGASMQPLADALRISGQLAAPLGCAVASQWIADGTAQAVIEALRREIAARYRLACQWLSADGFTGDPAAFHLWLPLPPRWSRHQLLEELGTMGGALVASDPFVVEGPAPEALRVGLGVAGERLSLQRDLSDLALRLRLMPRVANDAG